MKAATSASDSVDGAIEAGGQMVGAARCGLAGGSAAGIEGSAASDGAVAVAEGPRIVGAALSEVTPDGSPVSVVRGLLERLELLLVPYQCVMGFGGSSGGAEGATGVVSRMRARLRLVETDPPLVLAMED